MLDAERNNAVLLKGYFLEGRMRHVEELTRHLGAGAFDLALLRGQALYELSAVRELTELRSLVEASRSDDAALALRAILSLLVGQFHVTIDLASAWVEQSSSVREYFAASLAMASAHAALGNHVAFVRLIDEMDEAHDLVPMDERLEFLILKAKAKMLGARDARPAKDILFGVMREAQRAGWSYLLCKALVALGEVTRDLGVGGELDTVLGLLEVFLDGAECPRLTQLVAAELRGASLQTRGVLELDGETKRVNLGGQWFALHDKPLIYRFIEVLHEAGDFVTKEELAASLWADSYKPRVHDPRIFDLARRIRGLMESQDDSYALSLMSGRNGYKLVKAERLGRTRAAFPG